MNLTATEQALIQSPQIVVEEPTALMENSFPSKTLPERKVVESRELETVPRVHSSSVAG
jgi:hypothetical protein